MDQGNKYIFDLHTLEDKEDENRVEERRKRHRKSRIVSWFILLVFLGALATGGYFGVRYLISNVDIFNKNEVVSASTETISDSIGEQETETSVSISISETISLTPPEPEEIVPTEEELFAEAIEEYVASMSTEDKVAGIFLVTPEQLTNVKQVIRAGDGTKTALEKYAVGGIIYSDTNMISGEQFKEMISNTKEFARYPLFLAVDEELGKTSFSKAMSVASTLTAAEIGNDKDTSIAYLEEEKIARYMTEYGLNLNLGIVADVLCDEDNELMKDRSFGSDVETVSQMVSKCVAALNEYQIGSAVKFFPGQGESDKDTSSGLAVSQRTKEEMEASELISFAAAVEAGADMIVVSHISAPNLVGDNTQCSQSKYIMTDLIRSELGMEDVIVITDALDKAAISSYYESGEACITAIKAGADMVMSPEDFALAYSEVLEAVNSGVISIERINDSLLRIYKSKFNGMTSDEVKALLSVNEENEENTENTVGNE